MVELPISLPTRGVARTGEVAEWSIASVLKIKKRGFQRVSDLRNTFKKSGLRNTVQHAKKRFSPKAVYHLV
jgi:hypothetical protein